jgi:hypothetical protein
MVERGEVVVVEFDLRALPDGEAEPEEHVLDLAAHLRDQMEMAEWPRRVARQRHIDRVGAQLLVELGRLQCSRALPEHPFKRTFDLVAALAHGPALLGGQITDRAKHGRELRLATEVAHPQLLQLGR